MYENISNSSAAVEPVPSTSFAPNLGDVPKEDEPPNKNYVSPEALKYSLVAYRLTRLPRSEE